MTNAVADAAGPVLQLSEVVKEYPGPPPVRALDGLDLVVERGELLAIVGPSGSGKSTLLHIMGLLDRASSGAVSVEGQDVSKVSDRRLSGIRANRIGFVFQDFFLIEGMNAVDNVAEGLLYRGVSLGRRRQAAVDVLERVGLGDRLDHLPRQLSGGQRQRVAIARALVGSPAVVLADEPTGNLDSKTSEGIVDLLLELNDAGATIVVITHDPEVADHCRRRVEIRDGRVVGAGTDVVGSDS